MKCEVFFFFSLVTYNITMSCTRIFSCSTNARGFHTYIAQNSYPVTNTATSSTRAWAGATNGKITTTTTTTTTTPDLATVVDFFVGFSELFSSIDSLVNNVMKFKCCDGTNSSLHLRCCVTLTASSTSLSSTQCRVVIRSKKITTIRSYE